MLMTPRMIEKVRLEFKELGPDGVRNALLGGKWPKEKVDLARQWLERQDARSWTGAKGALKPGEQRAPGVARAKIAGIVVAVLGAAMLLIQLSGNFGH